ncbi:MAG: biotin attachment protein [bacterium]|nr:biotin attachment protein [bacterium]
MRTLAAIVLAVGIALLWAPMSAPAAPKALVEVKATLRGEVLAEGLAKVGDNVSEGDPLVLVRTQTGRAVAARATVDGRVAEMLVGPGTVIRDFGTVVARIEPK